MSRLVKVKCNCFLDKIASYFSDTKDGPRFSILVGHLNSQLCRSYLSESCLEGKRKRGEERGKGSKRAEEKNVERAEELEIIRKAALPSVNREPQCECLTWNSLYNSENTKCGREFFPSFWFWGYNG